MTQGSCHAAALQVTNPAIDPFREAVVTSLRCFVGPEHDVSRSTPEHAARLDLQQPILTLAEMEALKKLDMRGWSTKVIDTTFPVEDGPKGLRKALDRVAAEAQAAVDQGFSFLVLSDRAFGPHRVAASPLLVAGRVHHELIAVSGASRGLPGTWQGQGVGKAGLVGTGAM